MFIAGIDKQEGQLNHMQMKVPQESLMFISKTGMRKNFCSGLNILALSLKERMSAERYEEWNSTQALI